MTGRRPTPVEWVSEESDKNTDGRDEMARVKAHKGLQLEFTSKKKSQRLEGGERLLDQRKESNIAAHHPVFDKLLPQIR